MPTYKQEMPPPEGFAPIDVFRKAPNRPVNGLLVIVGIWTLSIMGYKYVSYVKRKYQQEFRENEEVRIALTPFLLAERERLYLKQIRRNRDYEASLMADVPGWKVGHWHDYPLYHNPRGLWCEPNVDEFYAHTSRKFRESRVGAVFKY